jgi:hypothetical protein
MAVAPPERDEVFLRANSEIYISLIAISGICGTHIGKPDQPRPSGDRRERAI